MNNKGFKIMRGRGVQLREGCDFAPRIFFPALLFARLGISTKSLVGLW